MNEHTHKQKKTDVANRTQTDVWTRTARQWYQEGQGLGGGCGQRGRGYGEGRKLGSRRRACLSVCRGQIITMHARSLSNGISHRDVGLKKEREQTWLSSPSALNLLLGSPAQQPAAPPPKGTMQGTGLHAMVPESSLRVAVLVNEEASPAPSTVTSTPCPGPCASGSGFPGPAEPDQGVRCSFQARVKGIQPEAGGSGTRAVGTGLL